MCATFTADDEEKRVVNATGDEIGTIVEISGETATVVPRAGVMDSIRATLGWRSSSDEISIHEDAIDEITTDAVRLETETIPAAGDTETAANNTSSDDSETTADDTRGVAPTEEPGNAAERDPGADRESDPTSGGQGPRDRPDPPAGDAASNAASNAAERDDAYAEQDDAYEDPVDGISDDEPDGMETGEPMTEIDDEDVSELLPGGDSDAADETDDPPIGDATDDDDTASTDEARSEPAAEPSNMDASETVDEPAETTATAERDSAETVETDSAEPEPTDAVSTGIDADSLEDVGGSGTDDRDESTDRNEADEPTEAQDLLADTGSGLDPESAVADSSGETSSDARGRDTESMDVAEEIETGVDIGSATEPDETRGSDHPSRSDESVSERADPADEIDPGADVVTTMQAEQEPSMPIDPETMAGPETDVETGPETAARRVVSDAAATSSDAGDTARAPDRDRSTERPSTDEQRAQSSPVSAAFATQRAVLAGERAAVELALESQRQAARAALVGPMMVQRGALDAMESTTTGYLNAVAAMTGMGSSTRNRRQSIADSATDTAALRSEPGPDDLSATLEDHREHVRELRTAIDERADDERQGDHDERIVAVLERQAELLEQCQQHLASDSR